MRTTDVDKVLPFPFEKGVTLDGAKHRVLNKSRVMDMNTFFSNGTNLQAGFKLLMAAIGRFAKDSDVSRYFDLVDIMQRKIEKFYVNQGNLWASKEFPTPVFFNGYTFQKGINDPQKNVY